MEKHITKELADIASEMRLAGSAMTDLMARLDKVADELANEALIADDADEAKDARLAIFDVARRLNEKAGAYEKD